MFCWSIRRAIGLLLAVGIGLRCLRSHHLVTHDCVGYTSLKQDVFLGFHASRQPLAKRGELRAVIVGTRVAVEHTRGSLVGTRIEVTASPVHRDGRLHRFSVVAREADGGHVLGTGEVTRVVVDAERFLGRL